MNIYRACGRPHACCVELKHDEENDIYYLFDEAKGWSSGEMFLSDLETAKKVIDKAIKEAKRKE